MVRAKFRLNSYITEMQLTYPSGYDKLPVNVEKRTLNFTPVYGKESAENKAFWDATPSGSLQLSVGRCSSSGGSTTWILRRPGKGIE